MVNKRIIFYLLGVVLGCAAEDSDEISSDDDKHCVYEGETQKTSCFSTFREAIAFSTDGRIADAPESPRSDADRRWVDDRLRALTQDKALQSSPVDAIFYEHADYYGATLTARGSNTRNCTASIPNLKSIGWNDVISSFQLYNGCYVELYQHTNFERISGEFELFSNSMLSLGWWNDRTSSLELALLL